MPTPQQDEVYGGGVLGQRLVMSGAAGRRVTQQNANAGGGMWDDKPHEGPNNPA